VTNRRSNNWRCGCGPRGLSVWFDKWNLVPGEPWQGAIERALADSRSVAVFVGRDGLGPWHELEMRAALSQQVDAGRGFRVIPVLLPGATVATSANLPAFLKQLTWVQFQDTLDDANAWQRLLAGIRGEAPGYVPAASGSQWIEDSGKPIVPRGLRAFDERDRAFYLRLLPGARDRHGLPESIGFWKDALEQIDAERTFRVGLIFGPSGCGKSSSVRAGLIPHLAEYVLAIHLDATPDATEQQLLQRLRKRLPGLPSDLDLPDTLGSLRQDASPLEGRKLVLILDQFEQWLHAHPVLEGQPLVQALEHCDGGRLQAVVMVRDEFFLAIDRFMDALNVPIREGINMMLVDKFARTTLGACWPNSAGPTAASRTAKIPTPGTRVVLGPCYRATGGCRRPRGLGANRLVRRHGARQTVDAPNAAPAGRIRRGRTRLSCKRTSTGRRPTPITGRIVGPRWES
jgi:hypothetical protein